MLAIFALVLAIVKRRNRITALFGLMLLFGMFWMLGDKTFLWRTFFPLLPDQVRIGIHPEYTYCIFSLAIAGLAAIGLNSLRVGNGCVGAIAAIIAVDLFLVGSGGPMNVSSLIVDPGVTRYAFDGSASLLNEVRSYVNQNVPPWRFDTVDASHEWTYGAPILQMHFSRGHQSARAGELGPTSAVSARRSSLGLELSARTFGFAHCGFDERAVHRYARRRHSPAGRLYRSSAISRACPATNFSKIRMLFRAFSWCIKFAWRGRSRGGPPRCAGADSRHISSTCATTALTETPIDFQRVSAMQALSDEVKTLKYEAKAIEVSTQSSRGSLLVLSETYYPGWKAWLDDRPTPIYSTDIALRGVVMPPGVHRVRMEFRPVIFPIALGISIATAILLAILGFGMRPVVDRHQVR